MARRGPKPKPNAVKRLSGSRRVNPDAPELAPGIPTCPRHLDKVAKAEWRRLAKMLFRSGILTEADRAVLTGYCEAWSTYVRASLDVQKYGPVMVSPKNEVPFQSPYFNIMSMALKHLNTFAAEMGLTPSSRSRVTKATVQTDNDKARFFKVVG